MQTMKTQKRRNFDDDNDEEETAKVDPHSHQEILKHYLKQLRVTAPESFERMYEDQLVAEHQESAQDFPQSHIEGTFPSSVTASQFQTLNQASSARFNVTETGNNQPASSLNMDSLRSPWLSQQKSSMPKSSFCLSMSLSEGSSQHPKWRKERGAVPEQEGHQIPLSNNDSEVSQNILEIGASEEQEESKLSVSPSPRIQICKSSTEQSVHDDYEGDEIVRGGILLTQNDSDMYIDEVRERPCQGVTGDTDDGDTYNERSSQTIDRSQERSSNLMYKRSHHQSEVLIGEHLLSGSLNNKVRNQFLTSQNFLLPSATHTQDEGDDYTPQKKMPSPEMEMSEQNDSSQSQRIAQIRSMIEQNVKVQQSMQGRLLKRQTTQLPTNSSMLLASAVSKSASSPASGGHNHLASDFSKRRRNNQESIECISQRLLQHALGSTSTIDILKRDSNNHAATSTQSPYKAEESKEGDMQSTDGQRTLRNNFLLGTNKQSRLDNASSCSYMLSRSGASTVKEMIKKQLKSSTSRQFGRDSGSIPQILGSFASTANQVCTSQGQHLVTTSSFTGNNRQNTQSRGGDSQGQVSGHGSILQVFITEGVEEDTIEEEYRMRANSNKDGECGVSASKQSLNLVRTQPDAQSNEVTRFNQKARLTLEEQDLLEKQLMSNSQSLNGGTAVVATGGSCTPQDSKHEGMEPLQNSTPLQVLCKIKPASTEKIYVDDSNKEIVLQLEALQSEESRMRKRKITTPDCCLLFGNDEIQRVVSQVRKMEEESREGTGNKFAFEIERTDSLEFTRNSESGSQVSSDGIQKQTTKTIKENDLDRTQTEQNNFTKSKVNRQSLLDDSEVAHNGTVKSSMMQSQMVNQQQPIESEHLLFHSRHSLTSENGHAQSEIISEPNLAENLDERSVTSSQYNSEQVLMEASQTVTQFGQTNSGTEAMLTTEPKGSSMFPFELPHASSKVFDEGEMPIPARFKRLKQNKTLLKTSSNKKKPNLGKIVSSESQSVQSESEYQRSRVKDHVERFIRQSQDLGSTLGLIKEKISEPQIYSSVKQSMIGKGYPLSPQKVQQTRQWSIHKSPDQKVNDGDFLAALDRPTQGLGFNSSDGESSTPEYEIISGYQYPNGFSHPQTASGSQIHHLGVPLQREESAHTYKDSNLNMMANKKNAMNYNELIVSELSLNQLEAPYYADMPQCSIAYVPPQEVDVSSEDAYLKYSQENKHRMKAGSTFEQVVREFNRQNYFHQLQSPQGDMRQSNVSGSDNQTQMRHHQSLSSQQTDGQCNYFKQSSMTRNNDIHILDDGSDSAAEYDCADEDMDGSQSFCPADKILENNRARVQSMHFTKPTLAQGKPKSLKAQEKPLPSLKKLLFTQERLKQPLNTTRNSKTPFQAQLQTRSRSQSKNGSLFKDHTYQTAGQHHQRSNTTKNSFAKEENPYRPHTASVIDTASPSSEYQMQKTTWPQRTIKQARQFSNENVQARMPTIEENLISIENQGNPHTMVTEELKLPAQLADGDVDSKHQTTNGKLFNKSIWPSTIKDQSEFRQIQSMSHLLSSEQPAETHICSDEDQYYMLPYPSSKNQKQKFNRTVLSLNSSRQPTTKHQLESNFLQRSQSNGSAATSKPRAQITQTELRTQKRGSELKYFSDNQTMRGQLNFGKNTPKTPKPAEMKRFPRVLIQNPVTSETAEQINEIDLVGRGFTDSQQLSLDSEMQHMFGMTRQNFQPHQSVRPKDGPTPQLMMYATETHFPHQSCTSNSNQKQNTDRDSILDRTESRSSLHGQHHFVHQRGFHTQQRPSLTHHHSSQASQQSSGNCRNCSLEQRKRSITQSAFQKAIKMTQYLMSEIERLQKNNQETASVVANQEQLEEMLKTGFAEQEEN